MNIELRNIHIYSKMSEETIAFKASLYIDGKKIGWAKNQGAGGITSYGPDDHKDWDKIKEAECYCDRLPPVRFQSSGSVYQSPSSLETVIDAIIDEAVVEKENKRFASLIKKHQKNAILIGSNSEYKRIVLSFSIEEILKMPRGKESLRNEISVRKAALRPGEKILNTNIPKELL